MTNQCEKKVVLAMETGVCGGSLSLFRGGAEIASSGGSENIARAKELLPEIERMLRSGNVELSEVGIIGVSLGPGSFTGIRIGMATAKGLSHSTGAVFFGVSLLWALAQLAGERRIVVTAAPVGKNDVAAETFEKVERGWKTIGGPQVMAGADFPQFLDAGYAEALVIHHKIADHAMNSAGFSEKHIEIINAGSNLASAIARAVISENFVNASEPIYLQNPSRSRGLF